MTRIYFSFCVERIEAKKPERVKQQNGPPRRTWKFWPTIVGLLKCAKCGANLQIVSGRGRNHPNQTYGCPLNFHRGDSVCSNRVRRDILEAKILAGLQDKVLREDVVNYALDRFRRST